MSLLQSKLPFSLFARLTQIYTKASGKFFKYPFCCFCHRTQFVTTCPSTSVSRRSPGRKMSQGREASGRLILSMLTCLSMASSNEGGYPLTTTTAAAVVAHTDRAKCFRVATASKMAAPTKGWVANGSTCPLKPTTRR